jgi:hypothetical protein
MIVAASARYRKAATIIVPGGPGSRAGRTDGIERTDGRNRLVNMQVDPEQD